MGYIIAAQFTGRYSDYTLAYWLKRRGHYVPEDRLRAVFWGGGLILPGSVLAIGWVMERVEGAAGLTLAVLLLLTNGIGLMVRSALLARARISLIDTLPGRSHALQHLLRRWCVLSSSLSAANPLATQSCSTTLPK